MPGEHGKERVCFVIAPIGAEGSETRLRSDQVLKHIIGPAAGDCGYSPVRADKISQPGVIASQVIQHVVEDDLVVADLTGRNPNVFYELAVRHAVKKAVVQIIQTGEPIPFDVSGTRTIQVDHHDLDSAEHARGEIVRQIKAVELDAAQVDNPISVAIELQSLRQSGNPLEQSNAAIISMLQEIRAAVSELQPASGRRAVSRQVLESCWAAYQQVRHALETRSETLPEDAPDELAMSVLRLGRKLRFLMREARVLSGEDMVVPSGQLWTASQ